MAKYLHIYRDLISFLDEPGERSVGGSTRGPTSVRRVAHSRGGVGSAGSTARARRATNVHNANGGGLSGAGSATIPAMPPSALSTLSPSALAGTGRDLSSVDPIAELLQQVLQYEIRKGHPSSPLSYISDFLSVSLIVRFWY